MAKAEKKSKAKPKKTKEDCLSIKMSSPSFEGAQFLARANKGVRLNGKS